MSTNEAQDLPLDLGQQIASARRRAGLTQTALGARWGEHRTTISRWERGDGEPTFSQVVDLSELSGWPLALLARAAAAPDTGDDDPGGLEVSGSGCYAEVIPLSRARAAHPLAVAS